MKVNLPITEREVALSSGDNLLTTTDLKGAITYANPAFERISGYSQEEMLGKNHNLIRHPHMPPLAFEQMWRTIKSGKSWMGLVKNRCKNGDFYWVSAYVSPVMRDGKIIEFQSVRTKPEKQQVAAAESCYADLIKDNTPLALRLPALSLTACLGLATLLVFILAWLFAVFATSLNSLVAGLLLAGLWGGVQLCIYGLLRPLRQLAAKARKVGNNPLGQYLYTGCRNEIGAIHFALDMQKAESAALVGRMADAASKLQREAQELVAAVRASSQGNQRQQQETDQVATAVEEMAASIQEVTRNAHSSAQAANAADAEVLDGQAVVAASRDITQALENKINEVSTVISSLADKSQEISMVTEVINGIAEQTNLLALNAAIEAARAGEQGRGFAVVADEVRGLAGRTQQSTASIGDLIKGFQVDAHGAVSAMQAGLQQVAASVGKAKDAAEALNEINRKVAAITGSSAQIATAVEQQSAVSEEIMRSLERIRTVTNENAAAAVQSQTNAEGMAGLANNLEMLANDFWSSHASRA
ncbi:methyl-accepting chemotaxis protein [Halopseudomonas salegens]|uniref:Methyl-accepting chemotaxis sensory transducer with Pas/Pac sensor n=1 Tax=Halopseudomonas salegens TaxID=1434072 RepID=A0A1H2DZG2_9GAMM|nr:PAS domain-containing methyl-accepting chemotaxis protein [Halopseudomonas salegens]SDT88214.1 methyl-accepting chemotaxis sensory transducer with Pas/Pac sensor [Halopseudomonas salegens]